MSSHARSPSVSGTIPKFIVLDRDGVINIDSPNYIKSPEEWQAIPGSLEAIAKLTQQGFTVIICSNQSGVGRGLFTMETLTQIHEKMIEQVEALGGKIQAIYLCPHVPQDNCECRKPKPGMYHQIIKDFSLENVPLIPSVGDSLRDLQAADTVEFMPILVLTGNGKKTQSSLEQSRLEQGKYLLRYWKPENTFADLASFVDFLLEPKK